MRAHRGIEHLDGGPDHGRAEAIYRTLAPNYDRFVTWSSRTMRKRAVERLELSGGEVVLDVACGTGLSFEPILHRIGPQGRLIGIDLSAEMLKEARQKVQRAGWNNVTLVESNAEDAVIPVQADAVLLMLTHDVMRSPQALRNILRYVKPGGRVVAAGAKVVGSWWAAPVDLVVRSISRRYVTTLEGLDRPWDHLEHLVGGLRLQSLTMGGAYVAWGNAPRDMPG